MPINYVLFENNLTSDPDDYMAMVRATGTAELNDIIERIIQQGSTVTRPDIVSVLEDFFTAVENMTLEGMNVNTPVANFGASIKGIFEGQDDMFDASRHQLTATVSPGKRFRKIISEQGTVSKQEAVKPKPNPQDYTDINTEARNSVLTPGGMGQLVGHRLKFDPADTDQGIFFVASDGSATKVVVVGKNKPGGLIFMIPTLPAGEYTIEVRAAFGDEIRSGALDATLTVA